MEPGYTELLPEGAGVPVRAQRFAKKAALAVAGAGLLLGLGATLRTRATPAAPALRATAAKTGGLTTIGAADVAVCTDETADETSTCWEDFGGVCMYEKKSCNKYGGTKNTSGCGSGDSCFCCQDIDSSLIGDDDAVLAWIDSYIGDDGKRASRSGKRNKGKEDDDLGAQSDDARGRVKRVYSYSYDDTDSSIHHKKTDASTTTNTSSANSTTAVLNATAAVSTANVTAAVTVTSDEDDDEGAISPDDEGYVDDITGKGRTNDDGGDPAGHHSKKRSKRTASKDVGVVDDVDGKSAVDDDIAASESTKGGHKSRSSGRSSGDSSLGKGKSDDDDDEDDDEGAISPDDEGYVDDITGKGPTNDDGGDPAHTKGSTSKGKKTKSSETKASGKSSSSSKKSRSAADDDSDDASTTSAGPAPKSPPSSGSDNGDTHKSGH
ncbi:hypothetical protein JL722_7350 [Aureococcus anophagefferens]|nr:hypothetical protein JL722_7350 [Aureococcus anophagefferens]